MAFRIPVACLASGANRCFLPVALNRQIPPLVSSSVHGFRPTEPASRSFSWQALVADPLFTNRLPWGSMAKGCSPWLPSFGRPLTTVSGAEAGTSSPSRSR
jgi:hypothetical protein